MSQKKGVNIFERFVWVWDNAHDIVVARMVEAAEGAGISATQIEEWRLVASISDYAFSLETCTDAERIALDRVLSGARAAIEAHGDVVKTDLVGWSVLDGVDVSGGFLRVERLPVAALIDVVASFAELITGCFTPDPPGAVWLLGAPNGRLTIGVRQPDVVLPVARALARGSSSRRRSK